MTAEVAPSMDSSPLLDSESVLQLPSLPSIPEDSSDLQKSTTDALNSTTESVTSSVKDLFNSTSNVTQEVYKQSAFALEDLRRQIESLGHDTVVNLQSSFTTIEQKLTSLQNEIFNALPPEVKSSAETVQSSLKSTAEFVSANQIPLLVLSGSLLIYVGATYYGYRYGGYSGEKLPEQVVDLLQSDTPALLVDIRSEEIQQRDGIPQLRRNALGKGISIPDVQIGPRLKRRLNITPELTAEMTATYIKGHKLATKATQFVILGENLDRARTVARSLKKLGCRRAFVLLDAMEGWKAAGLQLASTAVYDASPVALISDKAMDLAVPLEKRSNQIAIAVGAVTVAWTIWNYHFVLQMLGVLGPSIGFVAYLLKKYDTTEDFLDDLERLLASFVAPPPPPAKREDTEVSETMQISEVSQSEANEKVVAEP